MGLYMIGGCLLKNAFDNATPGWRFLFFCFFPLHAIAFVQFNALHAFLRYRISRQTWETLGWVIGVVIIAVAMAGGG